MTRVQGEVDLSQARIVATIMAGDPSRGAISVETEKEIKVGEWLVVRPSVPLNIYRSIWPLISPYHPSIL